MKLHSHSSLSNTSSFMLVSIALARHNPSSAILGPRTNEVAVELLHPQAFSLAMVTARHLQDHEDRKWLSCLSAGLTSMKQFSHCSETLRGLSLLLLISCHQLGFAVFTPALNARATATAICPSCTSTGGSMRLLSLIALSKASCSSVRTPYDASLPRH